MQSYTGNTHKAALAALLAKGCTPDEWLACLTSAIHALDSEMRCSVRGGAMAQAKALSNDCYIFAALRDQFKALVKA